MKKTKLAVLAVLTIGAGLFLTSCASQSDVVSQNISNDAENFKIERDIVFYNGITGTYIAEVQGRCSVDKQDKLDNTLSVTCKIGDNEYIKDMLGTSDNVTWFNMQTKPVDESVYHYKVYLKPETVVPDFSVDTGQQ